MKLTARLTLTGITALLLAAPAAASEGGLPQLDPQWFASQVFWLAVHFVVLYFIAAKLILPRIAESLGRREGRIAGDLDQADRLQKEATVARAEYEKVLAQARAEAQTAREQSAAAAAVDNAKAEQALAAELATKAIAANQRIADASAGVRARMRDVAAEASAEILTKITGTAADKQAIDSALSRILDARLKEVA